MNSNASVDDDVSKPVDADLLRRVLELGVVDEAVTRADRAVSPTGRPQHCTW